MIRDTGDFYEAPILEEIARRVIDGIIVDVGAMIGNHTAFMANFIPGAMVHAFEPVAMNVALLEKNTAWYPNVVVHRVALSDRVGWASLAMDGRNMGHSFITGEPWEHPLHTDVDTAPLDSFGLANVRLIKIDVEGHEPEVLVGARATIDRWRPLIVIEDWERAYGGLLPGYEMVAEWEQAHQTFLFSPVIAA